MSDHQLFKWGKFTGAGAKELDWKVECELFTKDDWACIANIAAPHLPRFSEVWGVPRGGIILAECLLPFITKNVIGLPPLIVEDVWTTGHSTVTFAQERLGLPPNGWNGFVVFMRAPWYPDNVKALWRYGL